MGEPGVGFGGLLAGAGGVGVNGPFMACGWREIPCRVAMNGPVMAWVCELPSGAGMNGPFMSLGGMGCPVTCR